MQKNDVITLKIESVTNEGSGVGHHNGMAVFVPMTAPGDVAQVRIVKVKSSYCYGILESLDTPAPVRCEADCPVYRQCGGCQLRHMTYEAETAEKERWVGDAFRRLGGFDITPQPIIPSPAAEGYRNKAQYPIARGPEGAYCGFYAPRSHRVVPAHSCRLQPEFFGDICEAVCRYIDGSGADVYDETGGKGIFRHLYIRWGETTGQVMVCLVAAGEIPKPELLIAGLLEVCPAEQAGDKPWLASVCLNINSKNTNVILGPKTTVLFGSGQIRDSLCGVDITLSPRSFYQVNRRGAELLYGAARQLAQLQQTDTLLDLYCGAGTIGLSMAEAVGEVIGVEVVEAAVADARANAAAAGIQNARFICGDAGAAAARLAAEGIRPRVVVLDPPRKGCDAPTLEAVLQMAPERIVMISCNPATAARDAKILAEGGYRPETLQPVDMFPRTKHVECVCFMSRREK